MIFGSNGRFNGARFNTNRHPQYYDPAKLNMIIQFFESEETKTTPFGTHDYFTYLCRSISDMQEDLLNNELKQLLNNGRKDGEPCPYFVQHEAFKDHSDYTFTKRLNISTRILFYDPQLAVYFKLAYG